MTRSETEATAVSALKLACLSRHFDGTDKFYKECASEPTFTVAITRVKPDMGEILLECHAEAGAVCAGVISQDDPPDSALLTVPLE